MIPDRATKPNAVPYADFTDPRSLNLYSYVRNNPLWKAELDGHDYLCLPCIAAALTQLIAEHPRSVQAAKGAGLMALGTGEVAVAATTAAATEGVAAALGAGALGVKGGADFISGFTNVLDAGFPNPKVDVNGANKALQTVADPAGLVTTTAS
jgi:hypothetical protein